MVTTPPEAGKSSFDWIDQAALFSALPLSLTTSALDLGCGEGRYTLPLAERLSDRATIKGIDLWPEGINRLLLAASAAGLHNVSGEVANLTRLDNVAEASVDLVLMATVVHDLAKRNDAEAALAEVARVLRPEATLAVVEFVKIDVKPGPPVNVRLNERELSQLVEPVGFRQESVLPVGQYLYLSLFRKISQG